MPRDTVLCVTHSRDEFTIDRVIEGLERRGARAFRLDSDRFPNGVRAEARLDGSRARLRFVDGAQELEGERVRAVWMRRFFGPALDAELGPVVRGECERESVASLRGVLDGLAHVRCIDPLDVIDAAENKPRQLRLAAAVGLRTPRTLLTNDPAAARDFFAQLDGRMVAKLLRPLSMSLGAAPRFVHTSAVTAEDLDSSEGLRHCPMVFQERIEKARELRVAWVDGQSFAGAIRAADSARAAVDWRRAGVDECPWEPASLPMEIEQRVAALMRALGLRFGALDLIETPSGEHVFLEVNPMGEWGMLERDLGLPIADAIAAALLDGSATS